MSEQDNELLINDLRRATRLPDYAQDVALRAIISEREKRSQLLRDVIGGQTTFEAEIRPLVEENLKLSFWSYRKGTCNSSRFEELAKKTDAQFTNVLLLTDSRVIPRAGIAKYNLTEDVNMPRDVFRNYLSIVVGFGAALLLIFGIIWMLEPRMLVIWPYLLSGVLCFSVLVLCGQVLLGYPCYIACRRALAQGVLSEARFLDKTVQRVR